MCVYVYVYIERVLALCLLFVSGFRVRCLGLSGVSVVDVSCVQFSVPNP